MDNTINFYIPTLDGAVFNSALNMVKYMNQYPERFRDNVKIHSMYGAFNGTIWNGGRANFGTTPTSDVIEGTIKAANELGVALRYTYTNSLIDETMLNDLYCNTTMKLADNGMNEVLVNSPILEKHIRENYKNFKISLSTTACTRGADKINEATKNYDLVVLDYRDIKNQEILDNIEDKDKIEIMLDENCHKDCPFRKKHYDEIAEVQLYKRGNDESKCMFEPSYSRDKKFYNNFEYNPDTTITADELYGTYIDMGFRNFKLIGRNLDVFYQFESYIYYLVKPEWKDKVRYDFYFMFF